MDMDNGQLSIETYGQLSIETYGQLSMHGQSIVHHGQLSIWTIVHTWTIVHNLWTIVHTSKIVHRLSILWTIFALSCSVWIKDSELK